MGNMITLETFSTCNQLPPLPVCYGSLLVHMPPFLIPQDFIQSLHIIAPLTIHSLCIYLVNELMKRQRWAF